MTLRSELVLFSFFPQDPRHGACRMRVLNNNNKKSIEGLPNIDKHTRDTNLAGSSKETASNKSVQKSHAHNV